MRTRRFNSTSPVQRRRLAESLAGPRLLGCNCRVCESRPVIGPNTCFELPWSTVDAFEPISTGLERFKGQVGTAAYIAIYRLTGLRPF